ncbi:MAG: peptidoglycan-binding protein [Microcoleaceae cyanobacterium]
MIESYAFLHLALETDTRSQRQSPLKGVNWQQLSTHAYSCFLSLAVILAVFNLADTARAVLTVGDANPQVKQVQQRLHQLGYFHAHTTGYYGPITHQAVLKFQQDHGLPDDGIVGDRTLSALKITVHQEPQPHPHPQSPSHLQPHYDPIADDRHLIGLGVGDRGPGVKDLQKRLKQLGFFDAHTTGYFGSITRHAVIEFQKQCSIAATGLVTEDTLAALNARDIDPNYRHSAALLPAQFLQVGDVGATVGLLQQRLQELGYYYGLITESYSSETAAAVGEFQMNNGIEPTGMVDPTTSAYIKEQLTTASVPHPDRNPENASQYLQRKLRSQGHPNPDVKEQLDLEHPQDQVNSPKTHPVKPTESLNIATQYQQTQVKPLIQSASLPRRNVPTHPLRVTETFLGLGDTGNAVRSIQRKLRQLNYYNGPINGWYDPATEQAVIRFQRANQISQTGVVGPTTQTYLFNAQSPSIPVEEEQTQSETQTQINSSRSNPLNQNYNIPSARVKALQQRLSIQGLYNGPIDGVYNNQTQIAVNSAQRLYGSSTNEILFGQL